MIPANGPGAQETGRGRARVLAAIMLGVICFYAAYLFYVQVISGSIYRTYAKIIAQAVTVIPTQRGEIYDRHFDSPLVHNVDSFAVDITPASIPKEKLDSVLQKVGEILRASPEDLRKKIPASAYTYYIPAELMSGVSYETVYAIAERKDELPGISWRSKPSRSYVDAGSLGHVIGYVGDITSDEYKLFYNLGYAKDAVLGKSGIEKQYDVMLRGKTGKLYKTVDSKGKSVEEIETVVEPPETGKSVVLTIDRNVQRICEESLGPRPGAVVVLKPATGEVLAMVSYPWYDPNIFSSRDAGKKYLELLEDKQNPLLNRAIQSSYPPASTFKVIMTSAILEEQSFPPDKKILCKGEIEYGDRIFRCWIRKPGHGALDLKGALANSCDVYFWTVGKDNLGVERIVYYAKAFGLGSLTGIDLPGELAGFVPTPSWKEKRFNEKWLGGDTLNMVIGQSYTTVTPLQMADVVALVVNEGTVYRPHLLKEVRDPVTKAIVRMSEPEVLLKSDISKDTFKTVKEDMRAVITEGTGQVISTKAVKIAAKSGTAEIGYADRWHSWYVAYGPYDAAKPEDVIVVAIMIEAPDTWERWVPFATNLIFQAIFAKQSVPEAIHALGYEYLFKKPEEGR